MNVVNGISLRFAECFEFLKEPVFENRVENAGCQAIFVRFLHEFYVASRSTALIGHYYRRRKDWL